MRAPAGRRPGPGAAPEARRITVRGTVQGVGLRPWVHGLATRHGLAGTVRNAGGEVLIEVEGSAEGIGAFEDELRAGAPFPARLEEVSSTAVPAEGRGAFTIGPSSHRGEGAPIPPDVATCADCLAELFDPADRRHRYPFITCARCGPRFTIVRSLPYDRPNTTMAAFEMCARCRAEYEDPADRRFHAEAIACPACGPRLSMPLGEAVGLLRAGGILAIKGIGGFHLACDATSEQAVSRLRRRKDRPSKPLAVMAAHPEELLEAGASARRALGSGAAPIVIAPRKAGTGVADAVAPGCEELGVMAPYSPLHHLLAADFGGPLVMTSGNRAEEPIATGDSEARRMLAGIADEFLSHDRPIRRRCEDSVVRGAVPVRRSRGYAPAPLRIPLAAPEPLLAVGAELKGCFCLARGPEAFLSAHLGDLVNQRAHAAFADDVGLYLEMTGVRPSLVAHDLHPNYLSTRWALEHGEALEGVQHHHAHAAACLAEHGQRGPALGIVLDGTGYGPDGTAWGGEVIRFDLLGFERLTHLRPVPLPGGDAAVREPWRSAAAHLEMAGRPVPLDRWPRWEQVRHSLAVNAPLSSGAGRLFDAAGVLLGAPDRIGYEAEAAIAVERLAGRLDADPYPCRRDGRGIAGAELIAAVHDDLDAGRPRGQVAAAFHEGLASALAAACAEAAEPRTVVLTGGALVNLRLGESLARRLGELGFEVMRHRALPPNDGGISFGQAAVAAARMSCA
ncbi:MAG: carbamoyltransferase HypF [Solirubrobacterales bacterium]